ncbi:MAG: FprA family A-type flavoprotein [Planctomycetes bacterium]|nr:FprA family A-type flavoprotein [Planctomycetota bacterium]
MPGSFWAVKVTDRVAWVGAIDWSIRNFHGYATGRGTTYNAYLVRADKTALIDTVKAPFRDEMLRRISSLIDPSDIDVIISNHSEMDHTGCLPDVVAKVRPEAVYASAAGVKALDAHFHGALPLSVLADGQDIDLGGEKLTAFETKMCHWPDSMVSYLHGEKVLFSQDAFGMHLASMERFDDELPADLLERELARYYANILMPLAGPIGRALAKLEGSGLEFRIVAPDHGPIWRSRFPAVLEHYRHWLAGRRKAKAVVIYDTMWQSTALMARAIADGLAGGETAVRLIPLSGSSRSDVAAELLEASAMIVGSPTINNEIFPTVADVLCYVRGLRPRELIGAAFGSYGWSGTAVKLLEKMLAEMGVEKVAEPVAARYVPTEADLDACRALGTKIAEEIHRRVDGQ